MIRPFTLLCALLAVGSGMYLYQTKHRAQLLDRQIHQIREATDQVREHSGVLRAEYALLNDPQRLAELAEQHLPELKPTLPPQWSVMAELERRLPPVGAAIVPPAPLEPDAAGAAAPVVPSAPVALPPTLQLRAVPAPAVPAVQPAVLAARPQPAPQPTPPLRLATRSPPPTAIRQAPVLRPIAESAPVRLATVAPTPRPAPTASQFQSPTALAISRAPRAEQYAAQAAPQSPPSTAAEAIARIARGGPIDRSAPMVASALGMARSMVPGSPVSPASAATLYTVGAYNR